MSIATRYTDLKNTIADKLTGWRLRVNEGGVGSGAKKLFDYLSEAMTTAAALNSDAYDALAADVLSLAARVSVPVATEALLKAKLAATRYDKQVCFVEDTLDLWGFDAQSTAAASATVLVPDDVTPPAAGRWIKLANVASHTHTASQITDLADAVAGYIATGVFAPLDGRGVTAFRTFGGFVANVDALPESGTLYQMLVALDTGIPYEWDGEAWAPTDRPQACYDTVGKALYLRGATATDWAPFEGGSGAQVVANTTALTALTGYGEADEVIVLDLGNGLPGRVVMDMDLGGGSNLPGYYGNPTAPLDRFTPDDADGGNQRWRVTQAFIPNTGVTYTNVDGFATGVQAHQRTSRGSVECSLFHKGGNFDDGDTVTIIDDEGEVGEVERVYTMKDTPAAPHDVQIGASLADSLTNLKNAINADIADSTVILGTDLLHYAAYGVNRTVYATLNDADGGWSDESMADTGIPAFKHTFTAKVTVTADHLDPLKFNGVIVRDLGNITSFGSAAIPFRVTTLAPGGISPTACPEQKISGAKVTNVQMVTFGVAMHTVVTIDLDVGGDPPDAGDTVMVEFGVL